MLADGAQSMTDGFGFDPLLLPGLLREKVATFDLNPFYQVYVASSHYEKFLEVEIVFVDYCLAFREFLDFCFVRDLVDLISRHFLK